MLGWAPQPPVNGELSGSPTAFSGLNKFGVCDDDDDDDDIHAGFIIIELACALL